MGESDTSSPLIPELNMELEPKNTNKLIGPVNSTPINVCGWECSALLDTGSQVTTISSEFVKAHPILRTRTIHPTNISVEGAGGQAMMSLQKDEPCIHILHQTLISTLRKLMSYLVKPVSIKQHPLLQVPYASKDHQRADDELFIGNSAREFLSDHQDIDRVLFFSKVRAFYKRALDYMLFKFPLSDDLLKHAEVVDITKRETMTFSSVKYFAQRMQCLGFSKAERLDELEKEFMSFQLQEFPEEISTCQRADKQWHLIGNMKNPSMNEKYPHLSTLMKSVLVVFHSNADCERIFSYVTKTKTQMRASMKTNTLSDLIVQKQFMVAKNTVCYEQKYSKALLQKCKSGLYQKLSQDKSASDEGAGGSAE